MQRAIFHRFGKPSEVVELTEYTLEPPQPHQVRVKVLAAPINPADFLLVTGTHAYQPQLPSFVGIEGVGEVLEVGAAVAHLQPGDQVLLPPGGTWAEQLNCPAEVLYTLPQAIDPLQASMLGVNPITAMLMLTSFVDLQPGDWLLQNAANSAVGKLIVRLATLKGIRTLNIVRRESLVEELKALGATAVLVGEEGLAEQVKQHLAGKPLRLALDAIAGEASGRMLECLSPGGCLVVYGLLSNQPVQLPTAKLVFGDLSVTGFSRLGTFAKLGHAKVQSLYTELAQMVMAGQLTSEIEAVYPLSRIKEAVAQAELQGRSGKILLSISP